MENKFELRRGFGYFIKFVKKINYSKGYFYSFQISKKMQNGEYANFQCTWFPTKYAPEIQDGDKVKVNNISSVNVQERNGKLYTTYTLECELLEKSNQSANNFNQQVPNFVEQNQFNSINNVDINKQFKNDDFSSFNILEDDIQF